VEELTEGESADDERTRRQEITLGEITTTLQQLLADIETLKKSQ
jgi:hypothetical protein